MTTLQSIELFTAINFFVVGLSHFLLPKMWVDYFVFLRSRPAVGNIINALNALGFGTIILSFHFVWYWPQVVVTILGLGQVIKGTLYLLIPSMGLKSMERVSMEKANQFRWVGIVFVLISLALFYGLNVSNAFDNM